MKRKITSVIEQYLKEAAVDKYHRYHSWDHCRNSFLIKQKNVYHSLQLAFYLASWGMYRGSSGLLQKNHKIHQGPVDIFYSGDFDHLICTEQLELTRDDIKSILILKSKIAQHYQNLLYTRGADAPRPISSTDTLMSKIILGTFACVPAYDEFLIRGLGEIGIKNRKFNELGLEDIFNFYGSNQIEIEVCSKLIKSKTGVHFPIMKILDMYFWQVGYDAYLEEVNLRKSTKPYEIKQT